MTESSLTAGRFNELVTGFFEHEPDPIFDAQDGAEYWDFASTGCIGNLSPFIGYLWLMSRRENANSKHYVPKIASAGRGGGTIDTLSAGGYRFYSDRQIVRELVHRNGGYFFAQNPELTGYDKPLMRERRQLNLMASGELVLASILAKKLAIGTTHVVIDIKLGADTKMYPRLGRIPLPSSFDAATIAQQARFPNTCGVRSEQAQDTSDAFIPASRVPALAGWLAALLGGAFSAKTGETTDRFVKVEWIGPWGRKVTVNLLFSNADTPQCRAVGRLPVLLQLDLVCSAGAEKLPAPLTHWYMQDIPAAVGATSASQELGRSWQQLKQELPVLHASSSEFAFIREQVRTPVKEAPRQSLSALTVFAEDLPKWAPLLDGSTAAKEGGGTPPTMIRMDAYPLDDPLFESLKQLGSDDPAIGFWLHRLPCEPVRAGDPVVTAFYRAGQDAPALRRELVRYLSEHVTLTSATDEAGAADSGDKA